MASPNTLKLRKESPLRKSKLLPLAKVPFEQPFRFAGRAYVKTLAGNIVHAS